MKVRHGGSNVIDSSGVKEEAQFQIQASAHAFRILSSGLYSDKIGAVLREIGCNAADSHIAAGIADRPIEVKLPTKLDDQFYIKDWGLGLSHADITGLFTTYFSSNKSNTNEMTGAFGLGSKSPFSYTDSFAVTSAKDGTQRSYTAHIGADGSPVISLLAETPVHSDWPSGLMVSFPVDPKDLQEFNTKALAIYRWFKVKPILLGNAPIVEPQFSIVGSNFYLSPTGKGSFDIDEANVLMGNVAYPLKADRLGSTDSLISNLISSAIQLVMPIGAVMPTASREDLEYDNRTRENLICALSAAGRELAEIVYAKATEPAPTEWQLHARVQAFKYALPQMLQPQVDFLIDQLALDANQTRRVKRLYADAYLDFPGWIGSQIVYKAEPSMAASPMPGPNLSRPVIDRESSIQVWLVQELEGRSSNRVTRKLVQGGHIIKGQTTHPARILYGSDVEVVYADTTHAYPRVRGYVASQDRVVILVAGGLGEGAAAVSDYAQRVAAALGGLPVKPTSSLTLPEIVKARRAKPAQRRAAYQSAYAVESGDYARFGKGHGGVAGSKVSLKLAEVPEAGRYYLVGHLSRGRRYRSGLRFNVDIPTSGQRTLEAADVDQIMSAYLMLYSRGVPLPLIDGAVVLETGAVQKLKLKENGWKSLLDSVVEAISGKAVAKDLGKRLTNMPSLETEHWYHYRQASVVGLLLKAHNDRSKLWKAYQAISAEFPVLTSITEQAIAANDPNNLGPGTRVWLSSLIAKLPVKLKGDFTEQLSAEQLGELVRKAYPMTRFMDVEHFLRLAEKNEANAIAFLRQVLIPAEKLAPAVQEEPEALAG